MKWKHLSPRYIRMNCTEMASTGCWIWNGYIQSRGYGQVYVEGKRVLAHRLSWIAHNGEIPEGVKILHDCNRPLCCNPGHIYAGTSQNNTGDCILQGRANYQRGNFDFTRKKRVRKLSDDDVRKIRKSNLPQAMLSVMFAVSVSTISTIRSGKRKQLVPP